MIFLEPEELEYLTGYRRKDKQRAELHRMGIPFIPRHDGTPVVARARVEGEAVQETTVVPELKLAGKGFE